MTRRYPREPRWLRIKRAREAERRASTYAERQRGRGRRRVLLVTLAYLTVYLLGMWMFPCRPRPAHAAARVPVTWTVPAGARSYEAMARRPDGVELSLTLSADSSSVTPLRLAPADSSQLAWVLISTDWRSGAWTVRVRGCNGAGCAGWSNRILVLAGIPDTLWHLERPGGEGIRAPRDGVQFKRAAGRVGWSLERADSLAGATIEHQQVAQERERARLCELFGYWALRGAREACP